MNKLLIVLLLNVFLNVSILAQQGFVPKLHEFKGVIQTQEGEVIAGAELYFKKKNDIRKFKLSTDINGEFSIKLRVGNYEITALSCLKLIDIP